MNETAIARILKEYGVEVSPGLCRSIRTYMDVLLKWNQKVSLTSVTSPEEIVGRHFGESLFALHAVPLRPRRLVDVGSGAGFPGLALKLVLAETEVTLIEANVKKAAFLLEVVRQLGLKQVSVSRIRTEEMELHGPIADCVTVRAIGNFAELLEWSTRALEPNGKLVLWLGAEGAAGVAQHTGWSWSQPLPIPKSARRVLLVGSPMQA